MRWISLSIVVLLAGCSESSPPRCVEGYSAVCACPAGAKGAQVCTTEGAFGPCECPPLPEDPKAEEEAEEEEAAAAEEPPEAEEAAAAEEPAEAEEPAAAKLTPEEEARARLLGEHNLSLQWISWKQFGRATVTEEGGVLRLRGEQRRAAGDREGDAGDFLTIEGEITRVRPRDFTFRGTIVTRVSHIAGGQECRREGEFTFAVKGKRRYWRLQQMDNPCDGVTDYVDIYFR
jgi:hypothetical protein